jgi:hypothetical protein
MLAVATVALIAPVEVCAQTVFQTTSVSVSSSGAATTVAASNSDARYNNQGTTTNGITALTFGSGFSMTATGPSFGNFDNIFSFNGSISGSSISGGTTLPISYNFTLDRNNFTAIPGSITWVLKFSDSVNTTSQQIATGSFSTASATFSGNGTNYTFASGVNSGATFLAVLELTYTGSNPLAAPVVNGTMLNTGFGGQGITLNASAIPEPSTYAAIAGAATLGLAVWRRSRKNPAVELGDRAG